MSETSTAAQFICTALSGLNTPIYDSVADQDSTYPVVVFSVQSAKDVATVGVHRIMSDLLMNVRAISTDMDEADALESGIDARLQAASGTAADGVVFGVVRESPLSYVTVESGIKYFHRGGLYRMWTRRA